jgi:hypothetical protein
MQTLESIAPPSGRFQLEVRRKGVIVPELCVDEKNLIVDNSKTIFSRLLGGDDQANRRVTKIAFGTNGSAPAGGNTAITGAFIKAIGSVTYPSASTVSFAFSLTTGENNGMNIMEFGLLTPTDVLFARKNRTTALPKDADLSFSGLWTISF